MRPAGLSATLTNTMKASTGEDDTMVNPIRILMLGFVCAAIAGCTSTSTETASLAPLPLVPESTSPGVASAGVTNASFTPGAPTGAPVTDDLYYIEFRARTAESYGHTFAMFGRRDAQGRILTREVAGLHPASTSVVPYLLGHLVPVPSETGPSDGDLEDAYMTANYRIDLTKAQYDDVLAYIRDLQASSPVWHAVAYNCSAFVSDIAKSMGLRTPNSLLMPEKYINTLREMNT